MLWLCYPVNWFLSFIASILRLGAGKGGRYEPAHEAIVLYEYEGCPFCRVAREAVSDTGVTVLVKPCPKGGSRYRPELLQIGGKAQFPYVIDPNTNEQMYESADIAKYLRKSYGCKSRPLIAWLGPINIILSQFSSMVRLMGGFRAKKSSSPDQPLELYGAERSPATRIVRELLSEMEIMYFWRSQPVGKTKTPYLFDPNTQQERIGAIAIRRYIAKTYRA